MRAKTALTLLLVLAIACGSYWITTTTQVQAQQSGAAKETQNAKSLRSPDVIYIPTPPEVVDEMLRMAHVGKGDVLYDLGCGDGRIVIAAAKQ